MKNTEEKLTQNDSELFQQFPVDGTPFTIIKLDDKYFLSMGKYRLSEPKDSLEDVLTEEPEKITWFKILQVVTAIVEESNMNKSILNKIAEGQGIKTN